MKLLLTLVICTGLLQNCKTNAPATSGLFTPPNEWPVSDSVAGKIKLQVDGGSIEYFSVNKTKFRFKKSVTAGKYDLDVFQNGNWVNNLTLPMARYGFFLSPDFDRDGFFDLSFHQYGNVDIYFFDGNKKQFETKPTSFSADRALLDSNRVIYGTNTQSSYAWNIDIFSLKGRRINNLLKSKIVFSESFATGSKALYALVYKCNNGEATDTTRIDSITINKAWADFGLNKFMKDLVSDKL
jgi:hypothetical protein